MKKAILLLMLIVFYLGSISQVKQLSLQQAVLGQLTEFSPKTLNNLSWRPETDFYTYVSGDTLIQSDVRNGKKTAILLLSEINDQLSALNLSPAKDLRRTKWLTKNQLSFNLDKSLIFFDVTSKKVVHSFGMEEGAENNDLSPDLKHLCFTINNNLFITGDEGNTIQITNDKDLNIVNGQSVHRNEFGINKGTFWSPKGNYLAFYRMDQIMVTDYPLVDISTRIATLKNVKYPMAGMTSHEVTVGIYNLVSKDIVYIKTGEPKDQFLTNIAWGPDEKSLYIAIINRKQNHMWFNQYDVKTGDLVKTLFEETNSRYVEPQEPITFLNTKPDLFIWQSKRDGWNHLFLYKTDGTLVQQLTKGNWDVTDFLGCDKADRYIYYTSSKSNPLEKHFYSTDLKSLKETKLTTLKGTHRPIISPTFSYFIDFTNSVEIPNQIDLLNINGKSIKNLLKADNPFNGWAVPQPEMIKLKTADGQTDLYARIIKPYDFDPGKKYPAIVYVYGGPHSQLVTDTWLGGARLWEYYMANKGYIMFTLDNRGTDNRGFDFESIIHRQLGTVEVEDQIVGVKYISSLPYVDANRIGVHGWSYGGFMTVSLMLKTSDYFKVGVAGGPVIDWKYYEVMYGERYMDTPDENPEGYKKSDLKNYVTNLKGKLLIIHDDLDETVVPQNSLTFLKECIRNGVQVDFFMYPQHEHNVRGKERVHLIDKIIRYFDQNL